MNIRVLRKAAMPVLLREINDQPEKLYLRGTLPDSTAKTLCVVGSRRYSPYGKDVCEQLIHGLSGYPISIVSGLALGIDALAHRAALSAGLHTIAVPGSGLNDHVLYPRTNRGLAHEICDAGGALLSEFEPDFQAQPWSFPKRNRIMAGLSHAVLVIEAEERSGTLITSRLATEYNRDVLTVPGSIFSKHSAGPHMLIRLGATPVRHSGDILEAFGIDHESQRESTEHCSPEEQKVLEFLGHPMNRNELIKKLDIPTSEANVLLSTMELKNLITEYMGEIHRTNI